MYNITLVSSVQHSIPYEVSIPRVYILMGGDNDY